MVPEPSALNRLHKRHAEVRRSDQHGVAHGKDEAVAGYEAVEVAGERIARLLKGFDDRLEAHEEEADPEEGIAEERRRDGQLRRM